MTLVSTAGHLHPGGLWNDLFATRGDTTKRLFRSIAKYFEPAGAVSWDVSMTGTPSDWRVGVKKGDRLTTNVTYDISKASWYESMGIMVLWYADGIRPEAKDPFVTDVYSRGLLTHGHLAENDHHGGEALGLPNPMSVLSGTTAAGVDIRNFVYGKGDLSVTGRQGRLPVVRPGGSLRFTNYDSVPGAARPRRDLPHGDGVPHALQQDGGHRLPARRRAARGACSTPASSATAPATRPPRRTATSGRRRATCPRAPTATSAACTRSCAARSE